MVQVKQAKAYIESKGWTLTEDHIYIDDAVSRAEFEKREGLIRLLRNASEFDAVVIRDETRLGGEMIRTMAYLQELLESGVRIFYHFSDEEVTLDDPTQKMIMAVRNYASELEREKISQRIHEHLWMKAKEGYVTGGRVFGYDNVPVYKGDVDKFGQPKRAYTKYQINEQEAEIVRCVFQLYADGDGMITVAKTLNDEGISAPRKGTGSWAPSSIRAILYNEKYQGVLVWNKYQKTYRRGTKVREKRPEEEWLRVEIPELRIVPQDLWDKVQDRLKEAQRVYLRRTDGKLWGRPEGANGIISGKYFLSGLAECAECGGSIIIHRVPSGKKGQQPYYCCSYRKLRGNSICSNDLWQNADHINCMIVEDLTGRILTPEVTELAIKETLKVVKKELKASPSKVEDLQTEKAKLEREISNLVNAVAGGSAPEAIVNAMKDKESRVNVLESQIARPEGIESIDFDLSDIRPMVEKALGAFREILLENQLKAKQGIKKLLAGKIKFSPVEENGSRYYHLSGKWTFDPIFLNLPGLPFGGVPKGSNILRVYNLNSLFYWHKSIALPPKKSTMRE
jgi:DNA invertase Pin-like site-specific DNA recombinase